MGGPQQQQQYGGLVDPMISLQGLQQQQLQQQQQQQQQQFGGYGQLAGVPRGGAGGLYDAYGQGEAIKLVAGVGKFNPWPFLTLRCFPWLHLHLVK